VLLGGPIPPNRCHAVCSSGFAPTIWVQSAAFSPHVRLGSIASSGDQGRGRRGPHEGRRGGDTRHREQQAQGKMVLSEHVDGVLLVECLKLQLAMGRTRDDCRK
jgi:hypothetical protein